MRYVLPAALITCILMITNYGVRGLEMSWDDNVESELNHGGGLNSCGCHFNRKTGECHCHKAKGCGCQCESAFCGK